MSTSTALPFARATSAATGEASSPIEGAMSMTRIGLFFIAALSIGIIVVAVMNLRMGADDDEDSYPNLTRDYIVLAASVLTFIVSAASIYMSYPNKG